MRRSSVGVLLGIMPWNYPYYQVARFAGPNLVIGNTILLKHAPQCPESAAAMEEMFQQAGFPADAYINIYATNEQIEAVIADPRVRGVSLTGSERAGSAVAEIAGRNLKKVVLELGGLGPVHPAEHRRPGRHGRGGGGRPAREHRAGVQRRQAVHRDRRALRAVPRGVHGRARGGQARGPELAGRRPSGRCPRPAGDRLEDQVKRAVEQGATLVTGGEREGNFFSATLLTGITPDNDAYHEEFFGPVASVYRVGSEDEAVELANDTPFGLGSYVFTTDPEQALRVADQIEAGMVFVNAVGAESAELPFGGVKRSGFGRELGRYGADEFVNKKMIRVGA